MTIYAYYLPTGKTESKKPTPEDWLKCLNLMAPRPGLEPGTYGLTGGTPNASVTRMDAHFSAKTAK